MDPSNTHKPVRRGVEHEKQDVEATVNNRLDGRYEDWPNEAAFHGLSEERGPVETIVTGTIPLWAAGVLYRTGPGLCKVENTTKGTFFATHWFDGLAQTHRFDIIPKTDGTCQVLYSSRRQCDALVEQIQAHGVRRGTSFGQRRDPCQGLFSKCMSAWRGFWQQDLHQRPENICVAVASNLAGFQAEKENTILTTTDANLDHIKAAEGHHPNSASDVWLLSDVSTIQRIDPKTLEPTGYATQKHLHPELTGRMSCAHALKDPETGDVFNVNLELGRSPAYRVFRVNKAKGTTDILATISRPDVRPAYIHSFFLSPSFVVLCVPSTHLALNGAKVLWEGNVMDAIEPFHAKNKCRWLVIDRIHDRGVLAEFETEAGFFFHSINAFEKRDDQDMRDGTVSLFCDRIEYGDHSILDALYYDVLLQRNRSAQEFFAVEQHARGCVPRFARYRCRIAIDYDMLGQRRKFESEMAKVLCIEGPHVGELPTINPLFAARHQRYVYSLPSRGLNTITDGLVKTDLQTRQAIFWNNPHGHTPSEAIFIPRPGGKEEDDGVLLSVVLDGENTKSYLICLDAASMEEIGRAEIEVAVTLGFHGLHLPSQSS